MDLPLFAYLNIDINNSPAMADYASPCSPDRKASGFRHPACELCGLNTQFSILDIGFHRYDERTIHYLPCGAL
jgi:hypothetical protein